LPDDKPRMVSMIDETLKRLSDDDAFKDDLEKMPYMRQL
jgi:hypothetical protein